MTEIEANRLAQTVIAAGVTTAAVKAEGHFFVVSVVDDDETFILRDDADWRWLRASMEARDR
jgi:hypothetical protein